MAKKYCSRTCSAITNNKNRIVSEEWRKKVSVSLKEFHKNHKPRSSGIEHAKKVGATTKGKYKKEVQSIFEVSNRTTAKLVKRLGLKCCVCGWNEASIDIHHIIPKKNGGSNEHTNLTPLCPNHHRLAHTGKLDITQLKSLQEILPENWMEMYFG